MALSDLLGGLGNHPYSAQSQLAQSWANQYSSLNYNEIRHSALAQMAELAQLRGVNRPADGDHDAHVREWHVVRFARERRRERIADKHRARRARAWRFPVERFWTRWKARAALFGVMVAAGVLIPFGLAMVIAAWGVLARLVVG